MKTNALGVGKPKDFLKTSAPKNKPKNENEDEKVILFEDIVWGEPYY